MVMEKAVVATMMPVDKGSEIVMPGCGLEQSQWQSVPGD